MEPLFLVDGTGYVFRAYHAIKPMRNAAGTPINAVLGFTRMLIKLVREHHPARMAVVFDAGGPTFRKEIYADYKATRQAQPEDLRPQLPLCQDAVDALGLRRIQVAGVEADDVLATLVRQEGAAGGQVVIVTGDKDLMQLVGPHVKVLRYNARTELEEFLDEEGVKAYFGVGPAQVLEVLALMGDTSDNVPGVDGIGEKTAAELIAMHGSVEGVLAAAPLMKPGKRRDTLLAQADRARLSRQLCALRADVPLPEGSTELAFRGFDVPTARAFFSKLGFKALLADAMFAAPADAPAPPPDAQGNLFAPTAPAPAPPPPPPAAPVAPDLLALGLLDGAHHRTVADLAGLPAVLEQCQRAGRLALHAVHSEDDVMRARLLGVALAWAPGHAAFLPIHDGTRLLGGGLPLGEVRGRLGALLQQSQVVGHDVKAHVKLLCQHGLPEFEAAGDSMLASYVLAVSDVHDLANVVQRHLHANLAPLPPGPRGRSQAALEDLSPEALARHACERADAALRATAALEQQLSAEGLRALYTDLELPLSGVLARMEMAGVLVRADVLRSLQQELSAEALRLETVCHQLAGAPFNLASPKQLAEVLFTKLGLPVQRKTKTGPSTDMDVLEQLSALHPLPANVLEHRQLTKLVGTYLDALPALIHPRTGRIHTTYHQAVAATGRLSSQDPNLQNIPVRDERGRRIRSAFVAPPGQRLLSADYSQIELRILAHVSGDPVLAEAFARGEDVHARTASEVLGIPLADVTRDQRRAAKTINFGLLYGMSAFGLSQALRISRAEAKDYLEKYFSRLGAIRVWQEQTLADARRTGEVRTLMGRRRRLPDINERNANVRQGAERMATNTPIQGTAADIIKTAMVRLDRALRDARLPARMILQVHDELVLEADAACTPELTALVRRTMEGAAGLETRMVVDVGEGADWGAAHA
ncbi:MAG: DNA polymerase I [Deltaproteobacteria bacterium]|nr:DNA polymerase I [Deltaproteobacteria bacterium]